MSWADIFKFWHHVENDLHDVYGIDMDDATMMSARTWRWLKVRIEGLLMADTRLSREFAPEPGKVKPEE